MSKLTKYEIWCKAEGKWVITDFKDSPPTVCPNVNTHDVDIDSVTILEERDPNAISIKEADEGTQGIWKLKSFEMQCAKSSTTSLGISFPYNVRVYDMTAYIADENVSDSFEVFAPHNFDIGSATGSATDSQIVEDVAIGGDTIMVSSILYSTLYIGYKISIQTSSYSDDLGEIIGKASGTITVSKPTTREFKASDEPKILFSNERIEKLKIRNANNMIIGSGKIGGSLLPKGTVVTVIYHNSSDTDKSFVGSFGMDY